MTQESRRSKKSKVWMNEHVRDPYVQTKIMRGAGYSSYPPPIQSPHCPISPGGEDRHFWDHHPGKSTGKLPNPPLWDLLGSRVTTA